MQALRFGLIWGCSHPDSKKDLGIAVHLNDINLSFRGLDLIWQIMIHPSLVFRLPGNNLKLLLGDLNGLAWIYKPSVKLLVHLKSFLPDEGAWKPPQLTRRRGGAAATPPPFMAVEKSHYDCLHLQFNSLNHFFFPYAGLQHRCKFSATDSRCRIMKFSH